MATTRFYRCDYCGVVFNGGRKSDWFYNEDDIWCHRCDSGHVGGRKLMGPNAIVLSSDESQETSDSDRRSHEASDSDPDESPVVEGRKDCPICGGPLLDRMPPVPGGDLPWLIKSCTGHDRQVSAVCRDCGIYKAAVGDTWHIAELHQFCEDTTQYTMDNHQFWQVCSLSGYFDKSLAELKTARARSACGHGAAGRHARYACRQHPTIQMQQIFSINKMAAEDAVASSSSGLHRNKCPDCCKDPSYMCITVSGGPSFPIDIRGLPWLPGPRDLFFQCPDCDRADYYYYNSERELYIWYYTVAPNKKVLIPAFLLLKDGVFQAADADEDKQENPEADELAEQLRKVLGAAGAPQAAKGA